MSEHGAELQTYNQELVKCLEDLKRKRNEVMDIIYKKESEKVVLETNLQALQGRLGILNETLDHHKNMYQQYDKTIKDTENGFKKIVESSQTLLQVVQQQTNRLDCNPNPFLNINKTEPKDILNTN